MIIVSVYVILFDTEFFTIPLISRKQLNPFMNKMHTEYLKVCIAE
jgi:hypothetical protein